MGTKVVSVLSVVLAVLFAACSSNSTKPTPTLASLVVSCDANRLTSLGQQARCTARATLSDGQTADRTAEAQWSSSDSSKVTVSAGVVTAVAPGNADVTAKLDASSAKQTLTVDVGCAFSVSPPVAAFGAGGGSQVVTVSALPDGCAPSTWTATSNSAGLTVSPGAGSGTGTVTVTAAVNGTQAQARTATIAGQTFTANMGAACTVAFSPAGSENAGPGAGQRDVSVVVSNAPCRWTASSADPWISVSQSEGTTSGTVRVSFAQNSGDARAGSVTFTGPDCNPNCRTSNMNVFVRQAGARSTLSITLEQGEQLTGLYSGTATGPNGFSCVLPGSTGSPVACQPLVVPAGTTVTITVQLNPPGFMGARPVDHATGCDSWTIAGSCTVVMNGDRNVTIGVGCDIACGHSPAFEPEPPDAAAFADRHDVVQLEDGRVSFADDPVYGRAHSAIGADRFCRASRP